MITGKTPCRKKDNFLPFEQALYIIKNWEQQFFHARFNVSQSNKGRYLLMERIKIVKRQ
jgi:hypothetical protein